MKCQTHAMTMLALLKTVHPLNFFLFNKQLKRIVKKYGNS